MAFRRGFSAVVLGGALLWGGGATSARDCNENGIDDAIDLDSGFSEDCNENQVPDECEFAPLGFGLSGGFPVARIPRVAVAADFDDDGLTDLATGNQNPDTRSSTISVFLSRGDQIFEPRADFITVSEEPGAGWSRNR